MITPDLSEESTHQIYGSDMKKAYDKPPAVLARPVAAHASGTVSGHGGVEVLTGQSTGAFIVGGLQL